MKWTPDNILHAIATRTYGQYPGQHIRAFPRDMKIGEIREITVTLYEPRGVTRAAEYRTGRALRVSDDLCVMCPGLPSPGQYYHS